MKFSTLTQKPWFRKAVKWGAIGLAAAFVAIQFVPVEGVGENPDETFALDAPPEVEAILRKACFDCHSNETRWPWYSRIAPVSWLLAKDTREGRSILNFSEWGVYDAEMMDYDKESSWEQIEAGEMPPWFYYPTHLDALLSDEETEALKTWLLTPSATHYRLVRPERAQQLGPASRPFGTGRWTVCGAHLSRPLRS